MSGLLFRSDGDGLVVASDVRRTVELHISTPHVAIASAGVSPAGLPWDSFGRVNWAMGATARDAWEVTYFVSSRNGSYGVAVLVTGQLATATHDLYDATMSPWRRFHQWGSHLVQAGRALPLLPHTSLLGGTCARERATLEALLRVLASRGDLRERLGERPRVERLARDLPASLLPPVWPKGAVKRDNIDIGQAMIKAGCVHEYGRPLTASDLPPLAEVLRRTGEALDANPFRRGRTTDPALLERIIRRNYYDVAPWPFAALVDD